MKYLGLLCCPVCKGDLKKSSNRLKCAECGKVYKVENGIPQLTVKPSSDLRFLIKKWNALYKQQLKSKIFLFEKDKYEEVYMQDTLRQLRKAKRFSKNITYLEIGCGQFFLGNNIAKKVGLVIGIDICSKALEIAKTILEENGVSNYLLIQGDILNMPIKDNVVNLIYGGGVIEHFEDTSRCLRECYRVLKKSGVSFNTVPMLNLGSLTYRQLWGNIPNVPVLKKVFEFLHLKIFGGKHMKFGYEMSFLPITLVRLHEEVGFTTVSVRRFEVKTLFEFLPKWLRPPFDWLAEHVNLFWPMVKVVAKK